MAEKIPRVEDISIEEKILYRKTSFNFTRHEEICQLGVYPKLIAFYLVAGWGNQIGLCTLYLGAAAEELSMSEPTFRKHLKTVCNALGWKYDRKYRLLYIPTWWRHNMPTGGNVLAGNLKDLYPLPKCDLMLEFLDNTKHLPPEYHPYLMAMKRRLFPELFPDEPAKKDLAMEEIPVGKSCTRPQSSDGGTEDPAEEPCASLGPGPVQVGEVLKEKLPAAKPTKKKRHNPKDMRPEWISEKDWIDLLEHRREMGSPLSKKPMELLIRQLYLAKENGHSPHDCIEEIITRSWKSFKAEWMGVAKKELKASPGEAECLRTKRMLDARENWQPPTAQEELWTETSFLVYEGKITQEQRTAILSGKVKLDDVLQPASEPEAPQSKVGPSSGVFQPMEVLLLPGPSEDILQAVKHI